MANKRTAAPRKGYGGELFGLFLLFLAVFLFVSIFSFSPDDPALNNAVSAGAKIHNATGVVGSYTAGLFVQFFGAGAVIWPFLFLYAGLARFVTRLRLTRWRKIGLFGLVICFQAWAGHPWISNVPNGAYGLEGGGFLGKVVLNELTMPYLRPTGTFLLWLFATIFFFQLAMGFSWRSLTDRIAQWWAGFWEQGSDKRAQRQARREERLAERAARRAEKRAAKEARKKRKAEEEEIDDDFPDLTFISDDPEPARAAPKPAPKKAKPVAKPAPKPAPASEGHYPSLDLLNRAPEQEERVPTETLNEMADRLRACLEDFNIQGEIKGIVPGPVVIMFEFKPAPGIKVSRIEGLTDDIARALMVESVRIEGSLPGTDSVGVEIPNPHRQAVYLREILESQTFQKSRSKLTLALGKDIHGQTKVADLSKMPHLLVAGATGAGKSVGINAFLLSILYKASPDEVKLLLVDPKRIELAPYARLPHLVHPVVTEMALANSALEWATFEMDCRYTSMAKLGVRNIEGYNAKLKELGDDRPEDLAALKPMPYLVIIIDELADLMLTAAKEVEKSIVRLAQLARAAGIHLVLATQRPSVDVVTGIIKANFPSRISFTVTSRFDSKTILDAVGAENLLGRGDMLFKPSGGKIRRLHGAYVDETEIARVVEFWESSREQDFDIDFDAWKSDNEPSETFGGIGDEKDPLYDEAVVFVMQQGKASISLVQRRFRIGYNKAARFVEQMEMDGLLGPQEGSKPRKVIKPE